METGEFANSTTIIFENIEIRIVSPVYEQKKKEKKKQSMLKWKNQMGKVSSPVEEHQEEKQ